MKTIAIANQKGGAGKTTTAYNLGIALTQQGYRVLMVDFDPQGNLSCYCGIPPEQDLEQTITELLMKVAYEKPLSHRECVYQSKRTDDSAPQVDFIPSNLRLASFELAMGTMMCREVLLKTCLEQYSSQYDYCIIDCSPSVGLLLTNALSAANEVIIPMQAQPFSVVGMSQLTNSISSVQRKINPGLHIRGVLLTMTQHTKVSEHYAHDVRAKYGRTLHVFTTEIPYNVKVQESQAYVINEEQAATVRRIFNLYAEGHGETTVAKMLIEENRKDGGGGLSWTASKVSRVLRKPTYKGYMTYNKSHIDDFLSHNRINHSEENFVLVKGNFEPIVSEELWETCNQIRSKRAAFVKGKDGRAHKFGVSFPQNKWTKILFCDCGMRFQIEGYDKTANGGKNMRLICARSKMFKKKDAARALNGIPCPAPYASEWKLELMAREVFRTVWKENAEDILGLLRMLDANLNTTGTPNDGNQLENKLSALNEELDDLVSQRASRSITMDDFLSRSTEINNEIINVEGLLQSSIQEQRPKARLDMHSIEAALSDDASFLDGKIEPGFLDRYANRIVKSNNRYIWMLQLMNVQQIMPIQSERQPIAMVTYKSGVPYDIEQEQIGKQDKESAGPDCATICRPQDFFLNMSRTKRKRKLVEWLESCQENQVRVLDEKIPLLSFAVDFVTAYEYQKARGIKIHPGLWKDMRVDIFLVKKENREIQKEYL